MAEKFDATARPEFGISTSLVEGTLYVQDYERSYEADIKEFRDGWTKDQQTLSLMEGLSVTHAYPGCDGVASSQVAARNTVGVPIQSARMTLREIVTEPFMRGLNNGAEPTKSQRLMCCDGLLVKGLRVEVVMLGKYNADHYPANHNPAGTPPYAVGTVLSGTVMLKCATEVDEATGTLLTVGFPVTSDAGDITVSNPIVTEFSVIRNIGEFVEFSAKLVGQAGNTETYAAGQTHLLVPNLILGTTLSGFEGYYSLERSIELREGRLARMSERAMLFPGPDYGDGF